MANELFKCVVATTNISYVSEYVFLTQYITIFFTYTFYSLKTCHEIQTLQTLQFLTMQIPLLSGFQPEATA